MVRRMSPKAACFPRRLLGSWLAVASLLCHAGADNIYLTDGRSLTDVTVVSESIKEVSYREKGKTTDVKLPSDGVLRITFLPLPKAIDAAETMAADGNVEDAIDQLKTFAESVLDGSNKTVKQSWAPAHALYRAMELAGSIGDQKTVVALSDLLTSKIRDSRRTPIAFLTKAQAQRAIADAEGAKATAEALRALALEHGLSRRWTLEADLIVVMADSSLSLEKRREQLKGIVTSAGNEFRAVGNRARVFEAESWIEGSTKEFGKAIEIFQTVSGDASADGDTLAGAFAGLGDCLFQEAQSAEPSQKEGLLEDAVIAYLRVSLLYPEHSGYAAKATFFAGRVFETMQSEQSKLRARRMYKTVMDRYPQSDWAQQAKSARR